MYPGQAKTPPATTIEAVDRRAFLRLGASALAGSVGAVSLRPTAAYAATKRRKPKWPSAKLPASAATTIDDSQFLSVQQLAAYGQEINEIGLRICGGPKHETYVRTLAMRLVQAGLQNVHLEPAPLRRWEATHWSLSVGGKTYPYTYYMPYTQPTGRHGLTAPMVLVENSNTDVKGKIAVVEFPPGSIPFAEFAAISYPGGIYDPHGQFDLAGDYIRPWVSTAGVQSQLDSYVAAGALGIIGILTGEEGPEKVKQYTPYDGRSRSLTGLWIDGTGGAEVKQLAEAGAKVTMVLQANVRNVLTHNVIGFIPGMSDQLTVLHSHTDGTNGMEENGPIPVLAAAQYMARLPKSTLERTIMVMLSTGHFAGGVGIRNYIQQHQNDTIPQITSILTLEHVGCLEVLPNAKGDLALTGKPELAAWFGPDAQGLVNATIEHEHRDNLSGAVMRPQPAAAPTYYPQQPTETQTGWPGEGTYWWWFAGLTCGNQITGPWDLLTADQDITSLVDYRLMQTDAMSTVKAAVELAATSELLLRPLPE